MLGIEDELILAEFEEGEKSNPSLQKVVGNQVIYASRKLNRTNDYGRPVLCDFGQARFGSARYDGDIQPYRYRAPEILLRTTWDEKVDIWNLAIIVSGPLNPFLNNATNFSRHGTFSNRTNCSTLKIRIIKTRVLITSLR